MRPTLRTGVATLALVIAVAGCGGGVVTPPATDDFLPVFSNAWKNVANAAHTFQLNSTDDGEATGSFDGSENHPTLNESLVEGTFTNSTNVFIIKRAAGNLTYAGKFTHADTLRLTRSGETIVIARVTF